VAPGPDVCPRTTCATHQPTAGWPGFFSFGDILDQRYRVEEILGAGGAGVTYRCVDLINGEQTALKVLHGDRKRGTLANRLIIEGEVLEVLDHAHIVPFRALKVVGDDAYYLATLHMAGGSLDRFVRRNGPLTPVGTVTAGRQLAMGLDYVHAGGIVHRDIKPANVLLEVADSHRPVVCLADFGIARLFRDPRPLLGGLTRTGAFIGTPEYAAPEQVRGEKGVGPAADAFALGALLHFAASGEALLRRDDIVDWKAFRDRRWDPEMRPRLTDLVEASDAEAADALALLDSAIDALMHRVPSQRLDPGMAAMRFGANPAQLAPVDQPIFAPPTLSGSTADELDEVFQSILDPEALIPEAPLDEVVGAATTKPVLIGPLSGPGPSPADDLDDDEVLWPTAEHRRNRRHGWLAFAAALLVGTAFAYPGGPGALLGPDRAARLGAVGEALVSGFATSPTSYEARDATEAPADLVRAEPRVRIREMPKGATPQRAALLPVPPPRRSVPVKPTSDPEPSEPSGVAVSRPAKRPPQTVAEVEPVRGYMPRARLTEPQIEPEPESQPEPAVVSHLDAWASNDADDRPLSEVLGQAEAESRDDLAYETARAALAEDERALRWIQQAREQDARVDRMRSRWDLLQTDARQLHDSEVLGPVPDDDAIDLEVGILESLFPAEPRIAPMATSEHCD